MEIVTGWSAVSSTPQHAASGCKPFLLQKAFVAADDSQTFTCFLPPHPNLPGGDDAGCMGLTPSKQAFDVRRQRLSLARGHIYLPSISTREEWRGALLLSGSRRVGCSCWCICTIHNAWGRTGETCANATCHEGQTEHSAATCRTVPHLSALDWRPRPPAG